MIIGLTGKMKSGKDTVAKMIEKHAPYSLMKSMAAPLKDLCITMLGLHWDDVHTQEGKAKYNEFWGMTNREILQKVGTDAMRNGFHSDIWVKCAYIQLKQYNLSRGNIIITDIRFPNEAQMVRDMGGIVVYVDRDIYQESVHESEKDLPLQYIDTVLLNHGSLNDLEDQVTNMLKNYYLI